MAKASTGLFLLTALLLDMPSARAGEEPELPFVRLIRQKQRIDIDQVVGDLLVVDGRVEIAGVVRGHVYAIDSEVAVTSSGVVLRPIIMARGALHLSEGAVLPKSIELVEAEFFGPRGESLQPGGRILLDRGATEVTLASSKHSAASLSLMKSTLPFDRFTPPDGMDIATLREWHPELGLKLEKFVEDPKELMVGGITRLSFVSDKVAGAFQRGYRGARGSVLVTGVMLQDETAADELWTQIEGVRPHVKVSLSVKSDLGPGAHWFYRHRDRCSMLWQSGRWFIAVETRLDDKSASVFQQKQFHEQVLEALARSLASLSSLPQGVAR
jgi:hypothetical protein